MYFILIGQLRRSEPDLMRSLLEKAGLKPYGIRKNLAARLTLSRVTHPLGLVPPLSEKIIANRGIDWGGLTEEET